ncbi:MAG: peptidase M28, partial [Bryobacteraceae bacterium]
MRNSVLLTLAISITTLWADPATMGKRDAKRWWSHVQFLASDDMEGRETGGGGYRKAAAYVSSQFERNGLQPAAPSGFLQNLKLTSRRVDEPHCSLALVQNGKRHPLVLGADAVLSMRTEPQPKLKGAMVFVGYGLTVPEMNYDDLAGLDL